MAILSPRSPVCECHHVPRSYLGVVRNEEDRDSFVFSAFKTNHRDAANFASVPTEILYQLSHRATKSFQSKLMETDVKRQRRHAQAS
ncbi:hypothetical protein BDZ89DRAFT_1131600 [Hymenopellis radicata]|nr:hypothetical protein BDZ89DRAFT_1131600 [Hymenopellis radicata]